MSNSRNAEILALINRLNSELRLARRHSLDSTVRMLQMAVLDLETTVNAISEDELRAFTDFMEQGEAH